MYVIWISLGETGTEEGETTCLKTSLGPLPGMTAMLAQI